MLKKMFLNNGYPSSFFDKILASFQSSNKFPQNISFENSFCIPYLGKESHHFANRLSALIKNKYNLKISPIYKTLSSQLFSVKIQNSCGSLLKCCL